MLQFGASLRKRTFHAHVTSSVAAPERNRHAPLEETIVSESPATSPIEAGAQAGGVGTRVEQVMDWIQNYVAKPNPQVGRPGPVCPFLPRTLKEKTLQFQSIDTESLSIQEIDDCVRGQAQTFINMLPTTGKARLNRALVLLFPDIDEKTSDIEIEKRQLRLKRFFVERGLMLGEFHPNHHGPGVRNPMYRPLRSPVPLLVIRHMFPSDLTFLLRPADSLLDRLHFIKSYLRTFTHSAPASLLADARSAANQTMQELVRTTVSVSAHNETRRAS